MHDKVSLVVNGKQIDYFTGYTVDSDLFLAADAWSFDHYRTDLGIAAGQKVKLFVNNVCELTGVIDRVEMGYDKKRKKLTVSGRDMMGLVCDHHCEHFSKDKILDGKTILQVANMLLADIPLIDRKIRTVAFDAATKRFDAAYTYEKIDLGETVFDVIRRFADGRGLLFWCEPDGTFTLGKPKDKGNATFFLRNKKSDPSRNNVLSATIVSDISQSHSSVTVVGQAQGQDDWGLPSMVNVKATKSMSVPSEFPFYKPLVRKMNKDTTSAKREASRLLEQSKARMLSLQYVVPYHSQNGKNWRANELCHVEDDDFVLDGKALSGDYLIYSRTFSSEKSRTTTTLKLGLPGVILNE
jgi:prophage tail gpP-like protein